MKNTLWISLSSISISILFFSGCDEMMNSNPETDSIVGEITRIETRESGTRILVEENVDVHEPLEDGGKKTWYSVSEKSELFIYGGRNSLMKINEADLKKSQIVKAWSTGIHQLSYPSQTGAKRVIVFK